MVVAFLLPNVNGKIVCYIYFFFQNACVALSHLSFVTLFSLSLSPNFLLLSDTSEGPGGLPISHKVEHGTQPQNGLCSQKCKLGPFVILSG